MRLPKLFSSAQRTAVGIVVPGSIVSAIRWEHCHPKWTPPGTLKAPNTVICCKGDGSCRVRPKGGVVITGTKGCSVIRDDPVSLNTCTSEGGTWVVCDTAGTSCDESMCTCSGGSCPGI